MSEVIDKNLALAEWLEPLPCRKESNRYQDGFWISDAKTCDEIVFRSPRRLWFFGDATNTEPTPCSYDTSGDACFALIRAMERPRVEFDGEGFLLVVAHGRVAFLLGGAGSVVDDGVQPLRYINHPDGFTDYMLAIRDAAYKAMEAEG